MTARSFTLIQRPESASYRAVSAIFIRAIHAVSAAQKNRTEHNRDSARIIPNTKIQTTRR